MTTLKGYKSLLLGSGLLLISLIGLRLSQTDRTDMLHGSRAEKKAAATKCGIRPNGTLYIKDIAERLFPVLKSLNIM